MSPLDRANSLNDIFSEVRKKIQKANETSKRLYDLRHKPVTFEVGGTVWKKNFALSNTAKYFTSKFSPDYIGPYRIHKRLNPWTYELVDSNNKNIRH